MTDILALSQAEIALAVEIAADVIKTNGLHKGYLYDEAQADEKQDGERTPLAGCRVDAVGAVNVAVFGVPRWPAEDCDGSQIAQAAVLAVEAHVGEPVPGWNDHPERTADDVEKALRETAANLQMEVAS